MEMPESVVSEELLREKKLEAVRELFVGEPEVIFDLVGAMKYSTQKGRFESGSFNDADENSKLSTGVALATGGKDRMLAIAYLHEAFERALLVTMSKTRSEDRPTYAAMTRDELLRKGVNEDAILLEENSVSTITEYIEAAKMWKQYQWKNMAFVSSNWHLPRAEALFNHIKSFLEPEDREVVAEFVHAIQQGTIQIQFIGSTDVLNIKSDKYKKLFNELESDPGMQARVETETKALVQIAGGDYGGKILLPEDKIWPDKL